MLTKKLSGTSGADMAAEDVGGSRGPSMTSKLGAASSSSNSLLQVKQKGTRLSISKCLWFNIIVR